MLPGMTERELDFFALAFVLAGLFALGVFGYGWIVLNV